MNLYRCLSERWRFTPDEISGMTLPMVYYYVASGRDGGAYLTPESEKEAARMGLYERIRANEKGRKK